MTTTTQYMMSADTLPRDVLIEILKKGIGLDGMRVLGVRPGRLWVPPLFKRILNASLSVRRDQKDENGDWVRSYVCLHIPDSDGKRYTLSRRKSDDRHGIEHSVDLHMFDRLNGMCFHMEGFLLYRGEKRPPQQLWTELVDLDPEGPRLPLHPIQP